MLVWMSKCLASNHATLEAICWRRRGEDAAKWQTDCDFTMEGETPPPRQHNIRWLKRNRCCKKVNFYLSYIYIYNVEEESLFITCSSKSLKVLHLFSLAVTLKIDRRKLEKSKKTCWMNAAAPSCELYYASLAQVSPMNSWREDAKCEIIPSHRWNMWNRNEPELNFWQIL